MPKTHLGIILKTHISIKMRRIKFYVTLRWKYFDNESYAYAKLKKPSKLVWATFWKPKLVKIASLSSIISSMHWLIPCVKISGWNIYRVACYAYAKNLAIFFYFKKFCAYILCIIIYFLKPIKIIFNVFYYDQHFVRFWHILSVLF